MALFLEKTFQLYSDKSSISNLHFNKLKIINLIKKLIIKFKLYITLYVYKY